MTHHESEALPGGPVEGLKGLPDARLRGHGAPGRGPGGQHGGRGQQRLRRGAAAVQPRVALQLAEGQAQPRVHGQQAWGVDQRL